MPLISGFHSFHSWPQRVFRGGFCSVYRLCYVEITENYIVCQQTILFGQIWRIKISLLLWRCNGKSTRQNNRNGARWIENTETLYTMNRVNVNAKTRRGNKTTTQHTHTQQWSSWPDDSVCAWVTSNSHRHTHTNMNFSLFHSSFTVFCLFYGSQLVDSIIIANLNGALSIAIKSG